ncbi:MAG: hypothetical protein ACFB0A_04255 [Croceivirga sp.]
MPLTLVLILAFSCKQVKKETEETAVEKEEMKAQPITISKLEGSPTYADAELILSSQKSVITNESKEVEFDFTINNYELGQQTDSPNAEKLANSGKGQHIHFILNNQPYSAHYEANFKKEIPDGVHHLVAFLSRSYHESVKGENAVIARKMEIGDNPEDTQGLDMDAPTLIYSRPKGTYSGKDTENLMLDFFVLNTELSEEGNRVRATINGEEFMITEWAPYVINGLPMGEVTVKLELLDGEGNLIEGPFNEVTRTVTLAPEAS